MNVAPLLFTISILSAMERIAPDQGLDDRYDIAAAILRSDATETEARWLVAMAYRESGFHSKAVGDGGASFCAFQVHLPGGRKTAEGWTGPELLESPSRCLEAALRILRLSLRRCAHLPAEERLSFYARGRCESEQGRRISWDRFRLQRYAFSP